jgi:hypothetical protein
MLRPVSSMRSEAPTAPQTQGAVLSFEEERNAALEDQGHRLHLLVGELLLKNHELRCEVARLRSQNHQSRRDF